MLFFYNLNRRLFIMRMIKIEVSKSDFCLFVEVSGGNYNLMQIWQYTKHQGDENELSLMFQKQTVTLQITSINDLRVCRCNRETMSESNRLLFVCLFCFLSVGCCCFFLIPNVSTSILTNTGSLFYRGTQRECSSKPLKHSIVKRILVIKRQIQAYFYPPKIFSSVRISQLKVQ